MNVLLVSECDKRALVQTRRILDQFAERRGSRVWQTPITRNGLDTLRKLLRKSARKNTAVACHWVRGRNHTELLWIVGDRKRFNERGAAPTNATQRKILRSESENTWHNGKLILDLADLAGLLHDLGKSITEFQRRLSYNVREKNLIRHEWISTRLFETFVGDDLDQDWLSRLASPAAADAASWTEGLRRDGLDGTVDSPFVTVKQAPLAQALMWLVLTHHRLPVLPHGEPFQLSAMSGILQRLQPTWNEQAFDANAQDRLGSYWDFHQGLPVAHPKWQHRASRVAHRLLKYVAGDTVTATETLTVDNPFVMHVSRLSLMLADHHYSSLEGEQRGRIKVTPTTPLLANTCRKTGKPNQSLEEHLIGVAQHGAEVARLLPDFRRDLPALRSCRPLVQRGGPKKYQWQIKAADAAVSMRQRAEHGGAFMVNMASTGSGKTIANARIMYALADPGEGMRCAFALGLRTLTLQTGKAFQEKLNLNSDTVAVRVGGAANKELFEYHEAKAEASGSASQLGLGEEDAQVIFEGFTEDHPLLRRTSGDPNTRRFLAAPILACTIDHLVPATDSQRGGRQIAPMLRLMSSDLVLDEPDDFGLDDLPALTRLVHWAGLLGSRVLLSSATLSPALVQGLFEAYRYGRSDFNRNCVLVSDPANTITSICCAWFDEFETQVHDCGDLSEFTAAHNDFVKHRVKHLGQKAGHSRRRAEICPLTVSTAERSWQSLAQAAAPVMLQAALALHRDNHEVDGKTGKSVSFGLVRMANIEPLYEVALALFRLAPPENVRVHLCVYHSQHPLLIRSAIETQLDRVLWRHDSEAVFSLPEIRQHLDHSPETDQMFIVLGSPVTEVGRDHDYDWALVEPSSQRSIIQLAGRVRRHREGAAKTTNILILSHNLRHFRNHGQAAFCKPGFETDQGSYRLVSHDIRDLIDDEFLACIDSRPRILSPAADSLRPQHSLANLEHARIADVMLPKSGAAQQPISRRRRQAFGVSMTSANASTWWSKPVRDALLTGVLPQQQRFRKPTSPPDVTLALLPDEDEELACLHEVTRNTRPTEKLYLPIEKSLCMRLPDDACQGERIQSWGTCGYMHELIALAEALDLSPSRCARKFGTVNVRRSEQGWRYHPALGFALNR